MQENIGRGLIIVVIINTLITPAIFWMDDIHFYNPDWHVHARYHLIWQGMIVVLFHLLALYLATVQWNKHPFIPLISAAIPGITWLAFLISAYFIVPMLGQSGPDVFPHHNYIGGVDIENLLVALTFSLTVVGYCLVKRARKNLIQKL